MALVSPGVQVTVTDQSQYVASVAGTVPYILLATAQDKPTGSGSGIAQGTTKANANKVTLVTSQRDLVALYGAPTFYGNGDETNEYGLLAAFSALGISNRCYIQRADINLRELVGSLKRPGTPVKDGQWYLDVDATEWGLNVWDLTTNSFVNKKPIVITDPTLLVNGYQPSNTVGGPNDLCVVFASQITNSPYQKMWTVWQKVQAATWVLAESTIARTTGTWVQVGTPDWAASVPCLVSTPGPYAFGQVCGCDIVYDKKGDLPPIPYPTATTVPELVATINARISTQATWVASTGYTVDAATGGYSIVLYASPITITGPDTIYPCQGIYFSSTHTTPDVPSRYGMFNGNGFYNYPVFQCSPNFTYPAWNQIPISSRADVATVASLPNSPTGSIWQNTSPTENGLKIVMKRWNSTLATYETKICPTYYNDSQAIYALDPTGGGQNIPIGTIYAKYDALDVLGGSTMPTPPGYTFNDFALETISPTSTRSAVWPGEHRNPSHRVYTRYATGKTVVAGTSTGTMSYPYGGGGSSGTIYLSATKPGSNAWTVSAFNPALEEGWTLSQVSAVFNACMPANCSTYVNSKGNLVFEHATGGSIAITYTSAFSVQFFADIGFTQWNTRGVTVNPGDIFHPTDSLPRMPYGTGQTAYLSNWELLDYDVYTATNDTLAGVAPSNGQLWYWNDPTQADIMIKSGNAWRGYRTVTTDVRGFNLSLTDVNGPIFSTTAPTTQSLGGALVSGDLWIDTSDLENYPKLYRWTPGSSGSTWVAVTANQYTTNGIAFADMRWAINGSTNPGTGYIYPISQMITSNYLDLDAANPALFPDGVLMWNTRRSGYNVKQYVTNYFNSTSFPNKTLPSQRATWLTISGNNAQGQGYMGRRAQRSAVVKAMKSAIDSSTELREEQKDINLIACPQYPELAPNMVVLNEDRDDTSFILVDTPLRLSPSNVVNWATNNNGVGLPAGDGLLANNEFMGTWYPSCLTTNTDGAEVVMPPSHMILRTMLLSDRESFPWIPSAGTQRGLVTNAYSIGYLDATTNKFTPINVGQGLRDVLYPNKVNPITFMPSNGIVNFGNKTTSSITSALDRINVARLVAFLRRRLEEATAAYIFEPNDQITRDSAKNVVDSLMTDLVNKRALYDYLVVCDLTNNTPDRIDRNELWIDVAIEPVKSVEFIYIPVRIKNTGAIAAGL